MQQAESLAVTADRVQSERLSGELLPSLVSRLKLRQLALVLALEETQNLHQAGLVLHLSQPAASKLLQEIEHALGVKLFERLPRGMAPTVYGVVAARHARLLLTDLGKLQQEIDGLRNGIQGNVALGTITAAVPNLVPEALALLTREHPTLSTTLTTDTSNALVDALQRGRLDIMIGRAGDAARSGGLNCVRLAGEGLRIVVGPGHRLIGRPYLDLRMLVQERWVLQAEPSPMRHAIAALLASQSLPLPAHPVQASSMVATACLLARTDLIAVMPDSVAGFFASFGAVVELPVLLPSLLEPFSLITVADRPVSPAMARVMEAVQEAAQGTAGEAVSRMQPSSIMPQSR